MKERDFLRWVLDVARRFGWVPYHVPAPMRAVKGGKFVGAREAAGLPDLILLHEDPPRLIFAEVKGSSGKLTPEQREFLRLARGVGDSIAEALVEPWHGAESEVRTVGVYSWRPGVEELIETILRTKVLA